LFLVRPTQFFCQTVTRTFKCACLTKSTVPVFQQVKLCQVLVLCLSIMLNCFQIAKLSSKFRLSSVTIPLILFVECLKSVEPVLQVSNRYLILISKDPALTAHKNE
jgi:hypothetical protein